MVKKRSTLSQAIIPLTLIGILVVIVTMYIVNSTQQTQTGNARASTSSRLTAGNDILSLEEDLRRLEEDSTEQAQQQIDALR